MEKCDTDYYFHILLRAPEGEHCKKEEKRKAERLKVTLETEMKERLAYAHKGMRIKRESLSNNHHHFMIEFDLKMKETLH